MDTGIDQHIFSPITLRFKNRTSEQDFSKWILQKRNVQMRLALISVLFLYFLLSFIDPYFSSGDTLVHAITIHRYVLPLILLIVTLIGSIDRTKRYFLPSALVITLIAAACNLYLVSEEGLSSAYVPELYFMILWIFTIAGFRFLTAIVLALLIISAALFNAFTLESVHIIELIVYAFWLFIAFILGFLGGHLLEYFSKTSFYNEYRLTHSAEHDPLTGLANRIRFNDRLEQAIKRASRYGECIALVYIDLDKFKQLNDTHGHDIGDAYLCEISQRILEKIRISDTLSRLGGDEFLVILEDVGSREFAIKIADAIREALFQPYGVEGSLDFQSSASIGVSLYPDHTEDKDELLKFADKAMYCSKAHGGNRTTLYATDLPHGKNSSQVPPMLQP